MLPQTSSQVFSLILAGALAINGYAAVTKIIDHGPDGEKLTFVVLGDGYAAVDQAKFVKDVDRLVINGVFGHDFYKDNLDAFNVYRVDLISKTSGVSTPLFVKDTALGVIYSGDWNRCWLEESPSTDQSVTNAASDPSIQTYNYVLVIANESGYGGCRRGSRLYVTSGVTWDVVAHEYGHGVANLFDEYYSAGTGYTGVRLNVRNCSTVLPSNGLRDVVWKAFIAPGTPLATDGAPGISPTRTVGMFAGCNYSDTGIYRPAHDCRMKTTASDFCPICLANLRTSVKPYLARSPPLPTTSGAPPPGGTQAPAVPLPTTATGTYMSLVIRLQRGGAAEVLHSAEVHGAAVLQSQPTSPFFFAIRKNGKPQATDFLPENPYLVRAFSDPNHPEKGENRILVDSVTITMNVPKVDYKGAVEGLGLQLYQITSKPDNQPVDALGNFTIPKTSDLLKWKGLINEAELPHAILGPVIARQKTQ